MRKSISILLSLMLMFGLALNIAAQTTNEEFDQVELYKQFIGTWKTEMGVDTTVTWEVTPTGKGFSEKLIWYAKGIPFETAIGITGFTWGYKNISSFMLQSNGLMARLRGNFTSKNTLFLEMHTEYDNVVIAKYTFELENPDKIECSYSNKGYADNWDDASVFEWTFEREKK